MTEHILSGRGQRALAGLRDRPPRGTDGTDGRGVADELIEELRERLLGGETHYPVRPGMTELRTIVARLLSAAGLPGRGPDSVVITASEGEALFATLIAVGAWESGSVSGRVPGRYATLLGWMGVTASDGSTDDGFASFTGTDGTEVVVVGNALLSDPAALAACSGAALLVGSLQGVEGAAPFRLGFAAGDPAAVAQVTKWKQASSICSPGPSQRALVWGLGGDS